MNERQAQMTGLFACSIDSRVEAIDAFCQEVKKAAAALLTKDILFQFELMLREFITNAVVHGNRLDPAKKVSIELTTDHKNIKLTLTDEGPGFNWRDVLQQASVPSEKTTHGRGLLIGKLYSNRLEWNESGNGVALWLRIA